MAERVSLAAALGADEGLEREVEAGELALDLLDIGHAGLAQLLVAQILERGQRLAQANAADIGGAAAQRVGQFGELRQIAALGGVAQPRR